jgi:hypothetical protein
MLRNLTLFAALGVIVLALAVGVPREALRSDSVVGGCDTCRCNSQSAPCTLTLCGTRHTCLGIGSGTCEVYVYCTSGNPQCSDRTAERATDCQSE